MKRSIRSMLIGWAAVGVGLLSLSQLSQVSYTNTLAAEPAVSYADTVTYGDERIVYTLDVDTITIGGQLRYIVDLATAPTGARTVIIMKPDFDSAMVVTGDTFDLVQTDSATALARATAWGVADPQGVTLAWHTPSATTPLDTYGIDAADSTRIASILGFPYVSHPATTADIPQLAEVDSLFEFWSDSMWSYFNRDIGNIDLVLFHYYYSRAYTHYSYWWKGGDSLYKNRADSLQRAFVNIFQRPPCQDQAQRQFAKAHWIYDAIHGDVEGTWMRDCIAEQSDYQWLRYRDDYDLGIYNDLRVQGRTAEGVMFLGQYYPTYVGQATNTTNWDTVANTGIMDSLIAFYNVYEPTDTVGMFRSPQYCDGMPPFQVAHAWIVPAYEFRERYGDYRNAEVDSIAKGALQIMVDNWGQHSSGIWGFPYIIDIPGAETQCAGVGSEEELPGLNLLIASAFMVYQGATGDSTFYPWVDSLVKHGIDYNSPNWHFNRGKEYNQAYYQFYWAAAKMADEGI